LTLKSQPQPNGASLNTKPTNTDGETQEGDAQQREPSQDPDESRKPYGWDYLWTEAYETVKEDPDSSELLQKYENTLMEDGCATPQGRHVEET
jgi:hypothetical protein